MKNHNRIILNVRVIIPRLYKESRNQDVLKFQTGSSKNAIARRLMPPFEDCTTGGMLPTY